MGRGIQAESEDYLADWEVEMVSALLEAVDREKENEEVGMLMFLLLLYRPDPLLPLFYCEHCPMTFPFLFFLIVHRLVAALALYVRLSPQYDTQIRPLLEVLQSIEILKGKLVKGSRWNAEGGIAKKDIRKLVDEVASKLCA